MLEGAGAAVVLLDVVHVNARVSQTLFKTCGKPLGKRMGLSRHI